MLYVLLYLSAIIAANLSVAHFGAVSTPFNAFFLIGLNLAARDKLHDMWGRNVARNMLLLIAVGGIISYAMNADAGHIAIASLAAFTMSEAVDAVVYHFHRHRPYLIRSNTSNLFGAAVDSVVFPVLAFGGFPWIIILGQFVAKLLGGFVWSLIFNKFRGGSNAPLLEDEVVAGD